MAVLAVLLLLTAVMPSATRVVASGTSFGLGLRTGSMAGARTSPTMTLLPTGEVLVAGGADNGTSLSSAELYDPSTGAWVPTNPMATARQGASATLLPNGQVLVAGGSDSSGNAIATAELYDPATGTWSPTGSMHTPRYSHGATLLADGRVLVIGGWQQDTGVTLASAEVYDPSTGTWTATGSMNVARSDPAVTVLRTGNVLVTSGTKCCPYTGFSSAEVYDPSTGTWTFTGSMSVARSGASATLLPNGHVLVAAGSTGRCCPWTADLTSAELYDPSTGTWTTTGSMSTARDAFAATLLNSGQVLVAGGENSSGTPLSAAESYDPAMGTWSPTGSLVTARVSLVAADLDDGQVLVAGGSSDGCCPAPSLASAELYLQPTAGLAVSPTSGVFKQSLVLTGTAFAPNETVNIYTDITTTAPTYTAVSGADGSFVLATIIKPDTYGLHTLIGVGQSSRLFGAAPVTETARLIMQPNTGSVGSTITANGFGFGAGEQVKVYWNNPRTLLGTATANSLGTFAGTTALTVTIPAGAPTGSNLLGGVGQTTHAVGKGTVTVQ